MIAYLRGETGADAVERALGTNGGPPSCTAHAVNVCEVYYEFIRASGEIAATSAIRDLKDAGVLVSRVLDVAFWKDVGATRQR